VSGSAADRRLTAAQDRVERDGYPDLSSPQAFEVAADDRGQTLAGGDLGLDLGRLALAGSQAPAGSALREEVQEIPTEPGSYGVFYEGVVTSLRGDAPPPVDPGEVIAVLEVLEAARSSSRERKIVRLPATD